MTSKKLVEKWFECWNIGDYQNIPISESFIHTSPFGSTHGRKAYLDLINKNEDKFLGYTFTVHDAIYEDEKACVRYTGTQGEFYLDVSEWYYIKDNLIDKIYAYYHIGEIRKERQLNS